MKTENTIKVIKQVHPDRVVMVKIGVFYHVYGKDSYILSYLFNYQIKQIDNNYNTCGFPKSTINKVMKTLEDNNISYMIVCKSDNYEIETEEDFKGKNEYEKYYILSHKYVTLKNRINTIHNYLLENINSENIKSKLIKVEEIIYEV